MMPSDRNDDVTYCYARGIQLLARREHTARELKQKLRARGFTDAAIDASMMRLIENKYLSEARFAETYVHSRIQRGYGRVRIRYELLQRGVSSHDADIALDEIEQADWLVGLQVADAKQRRKNVACSLSQRGAYLRTCGFESAQIEVFLDETE